jgi:hypothetical protein
LDFEKQSVQNFKEKCTMPVPISWADLDECKELWIQVVFAKISHNSDADSSHPIRDNRQLVPLNYYRLIDYFDNPTDFLKFLWMTVKIYHGLLRFPGKTFTDIFKPMDRYFDNIRTSITQKVKKCNGVVNGILAVATCAQLMYATTISKQLYPNLIGHQAPTMLEPVVKNCILLQQFQRMVGITPLWIQSSSSKTATSIGTHTDTYLVM